MTQARRRVKYAVVEAARLRRELTDWGDLYLSGRLHKPVVTLVPDVCPAPRLSLPHPQPSHAHRSPLVSVTDRSGSEEGRRDLHRVDGPAYLESASERPSRWSRATCLERAIRLALCPNVCVRERGGGARHTSSLGVLPWCCPGRLQPSDERAT